TVPGRVRLDQDTWDRVHDAGFDLIGVPESLGGSGGTLAEAGAVVRAVSRSAVDAPLAETLLGVGPLCVAARLTPPHGPLALAIGTDLSPVRARTSASGWVIDGTAVRSAWAADASHLLVVARAEDDTTIVGFVERADYDVVLRENLAGEPRDDVLFKDVLLDPAHSALLDRADAPSGNVLALARVVQMGGALENLLNLTVRYAQERVQFGRPIGRLQIIQQHIAEIAGEVAAAAAAADSAITAHGTDGARWATGVAKVRCGIASGVATRLAHQVLGAIGFTQEHPLQLLTRRLWSWRDEQGTEQEWATEIGRTATESGHVWAAVTSAGRRR
ncbi:MAG: acyl-CoA dehydrogenase family protein, partial [Rhodoglobus sp.]